MSKPKGATPRRSPNGMSFFAAMLIGMILTVGIGLFIYLWNPFNQGKTNATTQDAPMVQPKNQAKDKANDYEFYDLLKEQQVSGVPDQAAASQTISAQPDVVLTEQDAPTAKHADTANVSTVDNPMLSDENGTKPRAADNTLDINNDSIARDDKESVLISNVEPARTYILQINSFNNSDDADRRRAEVLMAGVDAQIVQKRLNDNSTVYQVISRPMSSPQMAAEAQRQLQNSRIDSLIVEQRREAY